MKIINAPNVLPPELMRLEHHHNTLVKNIAFEKYMRSWMRPRSFNIIINKTRKKYGNLTFSEFMHQLFNDKLKYGEDAAELITILMFKFQDEFNNKD